MVQNVMIFGFPHSGTTILKKIISHSTDVYEIIPEMRNISSGSITNAIAQNKSYILYKYPFTYKYFFENKNVHKIFILRNPYYIFSSLNKRCCYNIPNNHSIERYIETCKLFLEKQQNNTDPMLHFILYEDLFTDNYAILKQILDKIGIQYTDEIFQNENYTNIIDNNIQKIPEKKPANKDHSKYRTYQVNQSFENFNDPSKIDLNANQINQINSSEIIRQLYPNLELHK